MTVPEDPRVRFAAERTLLAWVRTGVATMGFGFVVARFGLFLREMAAVSGTPTRPPGISMYFGVGLTLFGACAIVLAACEHRTVLRAIELGESYRPPRFSLAFLMACVLAASGLAVAAYLLTV